MSDSPEIHLLLVEDDPQVVEAIRTGFAQSPVTFHRAATVGEAIRLLTPQHPYDAIVLDLTLPDGDGTMVADRCRSSGDNTPILMITAKDSVAERIAGLGHGADDYLCKPFAVEELSARLQAVLRRSRPSHQHILRYADVELDLLTRGLHRNEIQQTLSAREVDLLAYFLSHPDEVLPKSRILKEVWGEDAPLDSNVLHVYSNYLRNKLEGGLYPRILHTVRGVGYILTMAGDPEEDRHKIFRENHQPGLDHVGKTSLPDGRGASSGRKPTESDVGGRG